MLLFYDKSKSKCIFTSGFPYRKSCRRLRRTTTYMKRWATFKMKKITFILTIIILTFSCSKNRKSNTTQAELTSKKYLVKNKSKDLQSELKRNTVLVKYDPKSLDLSKNIIFIDTTRNSIFYKDLKKWSESKLDKKTINSSLKAINKDFKPKKINLKSFPNHFITLRKLNNQFVLYDRCDGIDPRYEIRDSAFVFHGILESDAESISKMILLTENSIELELKTIKAKSNDQKSILKIKKIDDLVYKMTYKNQTFERVEYLTTVDRIEKFDLIVNNCPTMKMREFKGFDVEEK